jgi:hypothetical protein
VGNFQGTYVHPGNSWDLWACTQKPDESLRDFIRCLSKRCTKLPSVVQSVIVHAFLEGTTYRDLVRELGRSPPVDSHELFDIATSFSFGDEAVGAIFDGKNGKRMDDVPMEGSKSKERQKKQKWGKKGKKPHRDTHAQGRDEDHDEALAVDPAYKGPRGPPRGASVLDDRHAKEYRVPTAISSILQCDMLKKYHKYNE